MLKIVNWIYIFLENNHLGNIIAEVIIIKTLFTLANPSTIADGRGKFWGLVRSEYDNQFGIYQPSRVSLLEPRQNNLNNPEALSEPCQTSKMECFPKIVKG